ncbi:MAG: outer membrane beta-barrel protein [Bacteroidia bacterium]|nr:outer membrane beta-barrel protein [Bacteroidia bacterium]
MRFFSVIILVCTIISLAQSQEKKIQVIILASHYKELLHFKEKKGQPQEIIIIDFTHEHYKNIRMGLEFTYNFSNKMGIRSGFCIVPRNITINYNSPNNSPFNYITINNQNYPITYRKISLLYINIPLLINYKIINYKNLNIYNSIGLTPEIYLSGREYDVSGFFFSNSTDIGNLINKTLVDFTFGVPIEYTFSKRFGIYIEPSESYGLIKISKEAKWANIFLLELKFGLLLQ